MKIENKESLKKHSKIELEKVTEFPTKIKSPKKEIIDSFISQQKFKFSYEGKIKQKTLDNNFNDFNKNIHSLLDLSEDEKFIFKIQKELNLQISQFYDNETFNLFYQGIMNLENKELLKKHSKIELKKALELSFSYKENTKLKILDNNFNRFKKNIYKIFEIQDTDLIIFYIPKELNIQMDYFYDNDTFTSFYKEINKIEDQELVKNSNFILEKSVELSFNYKEDTKTKILENNFNLFKKNIYKLFNIPNDDIIIFNIQKELNLKISQFYDKKTFDLFHQGIMDIENKELLENSKIELENTLELSFSYKDNIKLKILENNFNDFKQSIYKIFEIPKNDLMTFNIPKELNIPIDEFSDNDSYNSFYEEIMKIEDKELVKNSNIILEKKISNKDSTKIKISDIINYHYPLIEKVSKQIKNTDLDKEKKIFESNKTDENFNEEEHKSIICSNCYKINFKGIRFICSECQNYNLCYECEDLKSKKLIRHNQNHIFIRINRPIDINIKKYDNIIKRNNQNLIVDLKNKEKKLIIPIDIINNGEESLKNCYFRPVGFGENYIDGKKITINENIKRTEEIEVKIELNKIKKPGEYFSNWRMFTQEGIPFGKVFYLVIYAH